MPAPRGRRGHSTPATPATRRGGIACTRGTRREQARDARVYEGSLTKRGNGILFLAGNDTWHGTSTVLGGKLSVVGSHAGPIDVRGGTLGGNGSVADSIRSFPRGKLVLDPDLPVHGRLWLAETTKEELLARWLQIVRRDRQWNEDAARKQLVTLFEAMGPTDPRTIAARRRLSSILFS